MPKTDAGNLIWNVADRLARLAKLREKRDDLEDTIRAEEMALDGELETLKPAFKLHSITHVRVPINGPPAALLMVHRELIGPGRDVLTADLVEPIAWCDVVLPEAPEPEVPTLHPAEFVAEFGEPIPADLDGDSLDTLDAALEAEKHREPAGVPEPCDGDCPSCMRGAPCADRQPQVVS